MEPELLEKLNIQERKLDAIYASVEKTRKYFLWALVATLVALFLPLIGVAFAIPFFLNTLSTTLGI